MTRIGVFRVEANVNKDMVHEHWENRLPAFARAEETGVFAPVNEDDVV